MIKKYGMTFPDNTAAVSIELMAYSRSIIEDGDPGVRASHMLRCMELLWPVRTFRINEWTERRVKAFCAVPFFTMWGPSSAGKSTDVAAVVLVHWLAAPHSTTCTICSTTRPMLIQRIFGEVIRLYLALENPPGVYRSSTTSIILGSENTKNGIFGVAVLIGSIKEAVGNIIGRHNRRNVLIIDEMQATRPAAVEAVQNLQGGESFNFVGLGNPDSRLDPLGRHSEPIDGWNSVSMEDEEWDTKFGKCLYFDGLKSPGVHDPAKYPYLLKQADIDQRIKWYGENNPTFWSQTRGFIPPEGLPRTMFSESFFVKNEMMTRGTIWKSGCQTVAFLDPSFSAGGDRCALRIARVGINDKDKYIIEMDDAIIIKLEITPDEPLNYVTAGKVRDACKAAGVDPINFGIDITGTQSALADIIEEKWGRGIMRVQFGGKPTDLPISTDEDVPASKRYANRVTELWGTFYQFGRHGHIRGTELETVKEFCARLTLEKTNPVCVEPKTAMKSRSGKSPDLADCAVGITALVRERLGIVPGVGPTGLNYEGQAENQQNMDDPTETYKTTEEENFQQNDVDNIRSVW